MKLFTCYNHFILGNPRKVIFSFIVLLILSIYYSFNFELDASGESLVLENDQSLNYYREISQRYASDDFVIITYKPEGKLFSKGSLDVIRSIRDALLKLENIASVNSILDVPIVYESELKLSELTGDLMTLSEGNVGFDMAGREFSSNPLYRELLVSKEGKTTAIQALFKRDEEYYNYINQRQRLQSKKIKLTEDERKTLAWLNDAIKEKNKFLSRQREQDITEIRKILERHRVKGDIHLGGVPMIVVDMIQFIRHDLVVFGACVFLFLVFILTIFFYQLRWVLLPMLICMTSGLVTIGFLGYAGWAITVISSNFLSILLIITLSLTIHLIVRYRDLQQLNPELGHIELVRMTTSSMARPCFYTIVTTAVAFASLVVSEIRPVIDFGWIMVIGLCIAFISSFTLMPAILMLMDDVDLSRRLNIARKITLGLARLVHNWPVVIILAALFILGAIGFGINYLKVENRFINNFKSDTEIYQGMKIIDHELGGTMPMDIIIDPDRQFNEVKKELATEDNELDELFFDDMETAPALSYWLNPIMLEKAKQVHNHLESYPVVGKVTSIVSSLAIVEKLNGAPFDEFELALLRKRIPESISGDLVKPYLSDDSNQIRFNLRVIESDPELNRKVLLEDIHSFLINDMQFEEGQVHLTGMMVLYNNMLQSLFRSQILTIGAVFAAILFMFIILFRNIQLALIAIIPNIFSAVLILGTMGWLNIPLDMMTITIAAITIGISVDDTIHYIHRFQHEYPVDKNYEEAINRCHGGIGKAIYYTSIAIFFGFAMLSFSNFIPTIYFGLLTGFAMIVALIGDLLLLPSIILIIKPKV